MTAITATHHDNRGTEDVPFGFVYFDDGKRCAYARGVGEHDGVSTGTGGWPEVGMDHVHEAQRYLREALGADWNTAVNQTA